MAAELKELADDFEKAISITEEKGAIMKRVKWEIDLDEATAEAAATVALAIQRDPESTATVFDVACEDGKTVRVDLQRDHEQEPSLRCDNCWAMFKGAGKLARVFPDIPDLLSRIEPGGTVPAGECPDCGALVYPLNAPVRVAILLEGGLVKGVLADRGNVKATVLDLDIEGADDDEVITVAAGDDSMTGVPVTKDVVAAPVFVSALFTMTEQKENET
jgi:hypothetical protein